MIVFELDARPVDPLLVILLLLQLEDVTNKELLQVLIAVVDAHLLKAVEDKCLKAKDVQNTNAEPLGSLVLGKKKQLYLCKFAK